MRKTSAADREAIRVAKEFAVVIVNANQLVFRGIGEEVIERDLKQVIINWGQELRSSQYEYLNRR